VTNLNAYTIIRELARGGMGIVHVARHPSLDRDVALKVLHTWDSDASDLERFALEAEAVARLRHPNIVVVHAFGLRRGLPCLVMDLVDGPSLAELLKREGPFEPLKAAQIALDLAHAVEHSHANGILHRDLKPANVLLAPNGRPVLTDFGLARELSQTRERLTRTGEIVGTPAYMAPEQANGNTGQVGTCTDVYGLGATLYALLAGRAPFKGALMSVLSKVLAETPRPPSHWRPGVPASLDAICLRSLAKAPNDRYASAADLAADLDRVLRGEAVQDYVPKQRPPRVPLVRVGAALLVAASGLGLGWVTTRPSPNSTRPPVRPLGSGAPNAPSKPPPIERRPTEKRFAEQRLSKPMTVVPGLMNVERVQFVGNDLLVKVLDALVLMGPTGKRLRKWDLEHPVGELRVFDSGRKVALASFRWLRVIPLRERTTPRTYLVDTAIQQTVALDPSGSLATLGGSHGGFTQINLQTGELREFPAAGNQDAALVSRWLRALSPTLLLGVARSDTNYSRRDELVRWVLTPTPTVARRVPWKGEVTSFAVSTAETKYTVAVGTRHGGVQLLDTRLNPVQLLSRPESSQPKLAHHGSVRALCFSPDGTRLHTLGLAALNATSYEWANRYELVTWDLKTGLRIHSSPFPEGKPRRKCLDVSADGTRALIAYDDRVEVWALPD
jgi:serine/threonine protein kinase